MTKRKDNRNRLLKEGEYQRCDGRFEYRWIDSFTGQSRSIYSWRLNETDTAPVGKKHGKPLREMEREVREKEARGINSFSAEKTTLNDLFNTYMELSTHLKDTTRANQLCLYNTHARETIGKLPVGKIRYSDMLRHYVSLLDESGLTVSSVGRLNAIIQATFMVAVRDRLIPHNPCEGVMKELKKHTSVTPKTDYLRVLSRAQEKAFLDYLKSANKFRRWRLIFVVLFGTGIRVSELCGLTWQDVDLKNRIIRINRSLAYGKAGEDKCRFMIHPPKTAAGKRDIPMTEEVYTALKNEYEARSLTGFCPTVVDDVKSFVFWKPSGNLYQKGEIDSAIDSIRNSYNKEETERAKLDGRDPLLIPHFSAHSARRTFITRLVEARGNIKAIQAIAGHTSASMTLDVYAEASEDGKVEAIELLEECNNHHKRTG